MSNSDLGTQTSPKSSLSGDTSSAGQRTTATTEGAVQRKGRVKAPIGSIDQLLHAIYDGKFKRLTLKKAELTVLRDATNLDVSKIEELRNLALSTDRMLDKTRQLMLLCVGLDAPTIVSQIQKFAGDVLEHHPAFKNEMLTGVLKNGPEGTTEDRAIQVLTSQNYGSLSWSEGVEPMKRREMEQCKANSVYCLLLWFRIKRRTSVDRIQQHLQAHLWKPAALRYKTDSEKLRMLMNTRDLAAASIACALLDKEAFRQSQRADAARKAEEFAVARKQELNQKLADVRARLTGSQAKVNQLQKELAQEIQAHGDDKAHLENDYKQLRGQVLRRLKDEVSLLDEGLHALRREPPKVHVMVDHAERAIDGLKREMERLRE